MPNLRFTTPASPEEVVLLANWCAQNRARLRASGRRHGWSPLTISQQATSQSRLLIADTVPFLNRMELTRYQGIPAVRAEAGVVLEDLMEFLEQSGYGMTAVTAVGDVTIGGVLAIGAHGSAIPAIGESSRPQQTYGSLSNRILQLKAVVWDEHAQQYALRTFDRSDPEIAPLLASLGRTFITEATLAVEPNHNLRCQSYVNISADEMFAAGGSDGRTIESFLDSAGRIEVIWYAFTERPWLKVWSVQPDKPAISRRVSSPYNYPFSDNLPKLVTDLAREIVAGNPAVAPLFGSTIYSATAAGLAATLGLDLWGASKDTLLFIKPTTLRVHEASWVLLTQRSNVQQVLHEHAREHRRLLQFNRSSGRFPINMPVEYRVTGVDRPSDTGLADAQVAALSPLRPRDDKPEWDTAVWISTLTMPGTPHMYAYFRDMERWLYSRFDGSFGQIRPEWSKGWAYTNAAAWADENELRQRIPRAFRDGLFEHNWEASTASLDRLDPHRVFSNQFLDRLMPL